MTYSQRLLCKVTPSTSAADLVYCCIVASGIAIGHIYYFLEDVFPEQAGGFKILVTPQILYVDYYYTACFCTVNLAILAIKRRIIEALIF